MHLVIDARPLVDPAPGGVGRVARLLVHAYATRFPTDTLTCLTTGYARPDLPKELRALPHVHHTHIPLPNKLWTTGSMLQLCSLERELSRRHIPTDLIFFPNLGFTGSLRNTPYTLLIHDLSFRLEPSWFGPRERLWHQAVRPEKLIREAAGLFAASTTTKQDAVRLMDIHPERIHVLPFGPTIDPHLIPIPPKNLPLRYALFFGPHDPRKNVYTALQALRELRKKEEYASLELVMVGRESAPQRTGMTQEPWIHRFSFLSNAEMIYLIAHAAVLLYPSWYEGHGLPLHEAATLGTPRVASTAGALPETAPPGTLFANPAKPHHWIEAIEQALDLPREPQISAHTWKEAAQVLREVFIRSVSNKFNPLSPSHTSPLPPTAPVKDPPGVPSHLRR